MSRNGSYAKSMNGIVSFDDGDGTTIEGSTIETTNIICDTINSNSINVDYISSYANGYVQCLQAVTFNGEVSTNTVPVNNSSLCNKLYVDSVATSGANILPLTNTFTGTMNTFNNKIKVSDITYDTSSITKTNTTDAVNLFNTTTGNITIGSNGIIKLGTAIQATNLGIQAQAGGATNIELFKDITSGTVTTCNNLVLSGSNYNCSGVNDIIRLTEKLTTGVLRICNSLTTGAVYIADAALTSGSVNMCGSFIFKLYSIASIGVNDTINLFSNLTTGSLRIADGLTTGVVYIADTASLTTGSVNMCTTFLFKVNELLSSGIDDIINLFTNITTGTMNFMTGLTTGSLNIGTNMTTGTITILNPVATGTGGTINIGRGPKTTIAIGNATNNLTTANNGCCTIHKLRVGGSTTIRDIRFGLVNDTAGRNTYLFPTPMIGVPTIVLANVISGSTSYVFSITCDQYATTGFRFTKNGINSTPILFGISESFVYIAIYS